MILALLFVRTWRFNELQKRLRGVTHRVLSAAVEGSGRLWSHQP